MDAYDVLVSGWPGSLRVGAVIGCGGEDEDVVEAGVFESVFELTVSTVSSWPPKRHGDDVGFPLPYDIIDSLDSISMVCLLKD